MPNRIIKESIHTSETINELSDIQFRLWIGLITYVDDYGRGDARAAVIKGMVFPLRDRMSQKDIEKGLSELAEVGCINLYMSGGKTYLYFPQWDQHQRIQNKRSKCPDPAESQIITVKHGEIPSITAHAGAKSESEIESKSEEEDSPALEKAMDWTAFMAEFNMCNKLLTPIRYMSEERKRTVKGRLRDHPGIVLKELYAKIDASDFLTGRKDGRWQASFDWIFTKANFQKIIEGNYDNKNRGAPNRPDNDDFTKHQHEIKDV